MECATKAGLCRRLSRRVNMIASKNPVKAPKNASVIERLLNGPSLWPVRMNPVYAIAPVQRIMRTQNMGVHLLQRKYCNDSPLGSMTSRGLLKVRRPSSTSALYAKLGIGSSISRITVVNRWMIRPVSEKKLAPQRGNRSDIFPNRADDRFWIRATARDGIQCPITGIM